MKYHTSGRHEKVLALERVLAEFACPNGIAAVETGGDLNSKVPMMNEDAIQVGHVILVLTEETESSRLLESA